MVTVLYMRCLEFGISYPYTIITCDHLFNSAYS